MRYINFRKSCRLMVSLCAISVEVCPPKNKCRISLSCSETEPGSGLVMAVSLASTNGLLNEVIPVRHPSFVHEDVNYGRTVSSP